MFKFVCKVLPPEHKASFKYELTQSWCFYFLKLYCSGVSEMTTDHETVGAKKTPGAYIVDDLFLQLWKGRYQKVH